MSIDFNIFCQKYNAGRIRIKCRIDNETREISAEDLLPQGFCLLAFHSVYPYMYTYFRGGWFNWVNYDEHVVVNCPHPQGIAMYVKTNVKDKNKFVVEVMRTEGDCLKVHRVENNFTFDFNVEKGLFFALLDSYVSFFGVKSPQTKFSCEYNGKQVDYEITVEHSGCHYEL